MPHTPQPWTVNNNTITAHDGKTICTIPNNTQEDQYNAHLIAAAPKMLEVIKQIAEECMTRLRKGKDSGDLSTLRLCRSAMVLAENRQESSAMRQYYLSWLRMHTGQEINE